MKRNMRSTGTGPTRRELLEAARTRAPRLFETMEDRLGFQLIIDAGYDYFSRDYGKGAGDAQCIDVVLWKNFYNDDAFYVREYADDIKCIYSVVVCTEDGGYEALGRDGEDIARRFRKLHTLEAFLKKTIAWLED